MTRKKEIQTAWEIWNLITRLNDLLFDRYEEEVSDIWLREGEQKDPFLQPLEPPDIKSQG
ncbi:MAG: hypothetical protein EHM36_16560 [Deltaproteobacteria bacterium]|nr:MAG: hypothetical protein EHM36_16560 [Deltaproteobacteria bacterium]